MANKYRGEVELESDGKKVTLVLDFENVARLESATKQIYYETFQAISQGSALASMNVIRYCAKDDEEAKAFVANMSVASAMKLGVDLVKVLSDQFPDIEGEEADDSGE